jgi:hypothetical protein
LYPNIRPHGRSERFVGVLFRQMVLELVAEAPEALSGGRSSSTLPMSAATGT